MRTPVPELHLLCRIVETGSLRAAAAELGVDPSSVTRRLGALERRLGVKLIARSRVRSSPTDTGHRFYAQLKVLLDQLDALENEAAGAKVEPRGLLRVAAPSVFGARHVAPWLHELAATAPGLRIELLLGDRTVDLVEQAVDIALRIGPLADSSLIGLRLGTMLTAVVAAPAYLARDGTPRTPAELEKHHLIVHLGSEQGETLRLTDKRGRTAIHRCPSRFGVSSILGVMEAVLAGAGLSAGPLWLYGDAIMRGDLVRVLPRWSPPRSAVHALLLSERLRPAKITAALELLRRRVPTLHGIVR